MTICYDDAEDGIPLKPKKKHRWMLLVYKVPPEPTRMRVGIWRAIKSLGAVYLQASVCVLPKTPVHVRELKVLQNKITEAGGTADVLETSAIDPHQESAIIQRFREDREAEYQEFFGKCDDYLGEIRRETQIRHFTFAELQENDEDLKKLKGWLLKIQTLDFYGSDSATEAHRRLADCTAALDTFAQRVFDLEQQSKSSEGGRKPAVRRSRRM